MAFCSRHHIRPCLNPLGLVPWHKGLKEPWNRPRVPPSTVNSTHPSNHIMQSFSNPRSWAKDRYVPKSWHSRSFANFYINRPRDSCSSFSRFMKTRDSKRSYKEKVSNCDHSSQCNSPNIADLEKEKCSDCQSALLHNKRSRDWRFMPQVELHPQRHTKDTVVKTRLPASKSLSVIHECVGDGDSHERYFIENSVCEFPKTGLKHSTVSVDMIIAMEKGMVGQFWSGYNEVPIPDLSRSQSIEDAPRVLNSGQHHKNTIFHSHWMGPNLKRFSA